MEQHWHKLSPFLHLRISSNDALYYKKPKDTEKTEHLICSESIILIVSENFSTCNVHLHISKVLGKNNMNNLVWEKIIENFLRTHKKLKKLKPIFFLRIISITLLYME